MQYRVVTENAAGEQRTIEFNSRRAAYHQFSSVVTSRYTANASLEKWDTVEHQWQDLADMHISRQAPQPQAEPRPYNPNDVIFDAIPPNEIVEARNG